MGFLVLNVHYNIVITVYLIFRSNPLMNLQAIAPIRSLVYYTSLIDSCQTSNSFPREVILVL